MHPSDCVARVRTVLNSLAWYPVYLDDAGRALIERYGKWEAVESLAGCEDYKKPKTRKLFDCNRGISFASKRLRIDA
jgi:hypothetical protein